MGNEYEALCGQLAGLRYSPLSTRDPPPCVTLARAILYIDGDADLYMHDGCGRWTVLVLGDLSERPRILCCMSGMHLDKTYPLALARALAAI